jgi:RimJ/RimL family protein N-acetyltransferase
MEHLTIVPVKPEQSAKLAALAKPIWEEHFTPIIGAMQVAYMLEKFQSDRALREQMEQEGYRYFYFLWDGEKAGYLGIRRDGDTLFLSKLYLKKEFRGRGIARAAFDFLEDLCRRESLKKIWLTCNKYNDSSLAVYRALGLTTVRSQVTDIGSGFVMDDYVLERQVAPACGPRRSDK